ncbi:MAG: TonB-dependent receptor [Saprospiraceae bacterium]|nr:TonB-dependent receptor [Bacteroidia bacterium]NNE15657.1 TonB-dependent receptor [Saprospiraceae bacterium]NNL92407.1 TonB-dependent receptor [Saprospiraceae bacterium]
MKLKLILFFTLCLCLNLNAQFPGFGGGNKGPKIKGKITGQVIDSITNSQIGFATVVLTKAGKTKEINGVLTEEDGKFKLAEVTTGKYDVIISFLGYNEKRISAVELTPKDPDSDLGSIYLSPTDYMLDAVEVTEKRSLFESKVDRIVFNAEDDSSIAGGDATEVLRKVPNLSVDLDGNVSIRGSQNVRILINGKPSGMFSSNVSEALKMFPADQIKKVEVITSPGAKYDGEGSAGIINIITKKENIEGVAGSINGSAGNRQNSLFTNLNIGKGRFGFTTNASIFYSIPIDANNFFLRTPLNSVDTSYFYEGVTNTSRLGFNGSVSAFYDFNAYNAINSSFSLRGFGFDRDGTASGQILSNNFLRTNVGDNLSSGYDWNTDYTKKFEGNDKQELTFAVQVSGNIQNQENLVEETGFLTRNEQIKNDGDNLELTGQVDYVHPIGNSNKLEVGTKAVIRRIDSDSQFLEFANNQYILDETRSNVFLYDQDVYAGYASYNFFWKKLNFVTGLRYERTEIGGEGREEAQNFKNEYQNYLPNFAVSKSLKGFKTLKFNFSKRIQRPSLTYINPFVNTTDIGNITVGNPIIQPELTDQYEIGYNSNLFGITFFSTFYYKKTTAIIEQITVTQDQLSLTTFNNVGENNSFGMNIFTTKSVGKFTLRGGGDIYTYNATGIIENKEVANSALSYRLFTSGEFAITGTLKADFFGFFQAPSFTLQGENPSFSIFGVGFRKDFKNSSLGIRIIEPFAEFKNFDSDIQGNEFNQTSSFQIPFRSFGINFRYKFGKVDFKERKSKIKNSDQKQGQDQSGGQGGGQGGGMGNG